MYIAVPHKGQCVGPVYTHVDLSVWRGETYNSYMYLWIPSMFWGYLQLADYCIIVVS